MKNKFPTFSMKGDTIVVENKYARLALAVPPHPSFLFCKETKRVFGMIAGGDCTISGKREDISDTTPWQCEEKVDGSLLLSREESSSIWQKKHFFLRVTNDAFVWYHELEGTGSLEEIRYFRSCFREHEYGFAGNFDEIFTAAPNFREQQWFHPSATVIISNGNDSSLHTGLHALASVPHIMGLHDRRDTGILSASVFAEPGEYLWDEMVWNPEVLLPPTDYPGDWSKAGGFAIRYHGKKSIAGQWRSPQLVFSFPETVDETISHALSFAYRNQLLPRPGKHKNSPSWWKEPIYCTWDDQTSLAYQGEGDYHRLKDVCPGDYATENWTERWLQKLAEHGIKPGIVVLDDKWQKSKISAEPDQAKWPDLRAWIDRCHQRGIRVFLWGLAWHTEDIPLDEAITRDGKVVAGDVTNPRYEKRLREKIHRYFSDEPGCLNADGVKIDGLMALPVGPGLKNYGNLWGLELQRKFLEIVYTEAKKAKADACISTFAANPYLDEFTDMLRLADMFTYRLTTEDSMRWRAAVFHATNPCVPIDTDSQLGYSIDPDFLSSLDLGAELGIPVIYNAEFLRRHRFFFLPQYRKLNELEYRKIAQLFSQQREKTSSRNKGVLS